MRGRRHGLVLAEVYLGNSVRLQNFGGLKLNCVWAVICDFGTFVFALGGSAVAAAARAAILAYARRPKSTPKESAPYFTDEILLTPPLARPAYSDRMAYLLAEMSALAYYPFEQRDGTLDAVVDELLELDMTSKVNVREFLDKFSTDLLSGRRLKARVHSKRILDNSGFTLLGLIHVGRNAGLSLQAYS